MASQYTTACVGCGKLVIKEGCHREAVSDGVDYRTTSDGVLIRSHMDAREKTIYVCPGRGLGGASVSCRAAALKKLGQCPICGANVFDQWHFPCHICNKDLAKGRATFAKEKAQEGLSAFIIDGKVDGIHGGYGETSLSELFANLIHTLLPLHEDHNNEVEVIRGYATDNYDTFSLQRAAQVRLDKAQEAAMRAYLSALNLQVSRGLREAVRDGSNLLKNLVNGQLTIDGLNDSVAKRIAWYQRNIKHNGGGEE